MPSDLFTNNIDLFVCKNPGSDSQNLIQSYNDSISLSILAQTGQTADLFTITSENNYDILYVTPETTVIRSEKIDGTSLSVYSSPSEETGGAALRIFNDTGSTEFFTVSNLGVFARSLVSHYSNDLVFGIFSDSQPFGVGYISASFNSGKTTGYINLDSSSSFSSGFINVSGGSTAAGGSITTSNGGGAIDTTGNGSIQFGVAATRTTLNGSGSAVTVTLPATTTTLMGLAGTQTVTGAKTFADSTFLLRNSAATFTHTIKTITTSNKTANIPDVTGTILMAVTPSTTNNQIAMATSTSGGLNFVNISGAITIGSTGVTSYSGTVPVSTGGTGITSISTNQILVASGSNTLAAVTMSGDATIAAGGALTLATVPISKGGTGQTTANAGFNALSPMTTLGDIIYGAASGVATRLGGNTTTTLRVLSMTGTGSAAAAPAWAPVASILPANVAYIDVSNSFTVPQLLANGTYTAPSLAFASDTNTGLYRVGADILGFAAGGSACQKYVTSDGFTVSNDSGFEEHYFGVLENSTFGDYIWNIGYDISFSTWIVKQQIPLQFVGGGIFLTYASSQLCEFVNIYDIGLGDEFYIGAYNDSAGGTTGVNTHLRFGGGNDFPNAIHMDGVNRVWKSPLQVGPFRKLITTISATTYTALNTDYYIRMTSSSSRTVTLPTAVSIGGWCFEIKDANGNAATNNVTINTTSSQTIDGSATKIINTNYGIVRVISNGANWETY